MTTVLLFHHAQGQTPGFLGFAANCGKSAIRSCSSTQVRVIWFADSSLDDYDEQAAALLKERALAFLRRVV